MSVLLETALRKMVGIRGATPGIRVRKRDGSPSLVDIAPAVWNLRYLQVKHPQEILCKHLLIRIQVIDGPCPGDPRAC